MTISKHYLSLYAKLREDRLVPDDLDSILSTLPLKKFQYTRGQILYTLNDTFIINFSRSNLNLIVSTEQGLETLQFRDHFVDRRDLHEVNPYTGGYTHHCCQNDDSHASIGSALARFERSTLPEHAQTRTVVLRFLKIITPVKCVMPLYDEYIKWPKEGELFQRGLHSRPHVWSANIDQSRLTTPGFQLLWDA